MEHCKAVDRCLDGKSLQSLVAYVARPTALTGLTVTYLTLSFCFSTWLILLPMLYQVLKHATQFFSRETPNLANVILIMDHINDCLMTRARDTSYSPAIRAALGLAKKTLNRYYSRTDDSEAYRIAMSYSISFLPGP